MPTLTFQHLAELPVMREFYDLVWRLFGIKVVLRSCDGKSRVVMGDPPSRTPFCTVLRSRPAGERLCEDCDRRHVRQAFSKKGMLRYRCHIGMIEFIVPIFLDKEIISFLVCGQILDKKPTKSDWLKVRQLLQEKSINVESLEELYYNVNIISHRIQKDLMAQLQLFGNYIAYSQNQILIMKEDHCTQIAVRAESFIRNHFQEQITLRDVADAAYTSARNLRRVFRLETGKTVWEYLHGIRIAFACEQLLSTDKTCSQIAFDCGFGSIQQFNLVFRKMKKITPLEWRKRMR